MQQLIFTNEVKPALEGLIAELNPDRVALLCDSNTQRFADELAPANADIIEILPGDENKNLTQLSRVWEHLSSHGFTRRSVMVNVGGGMVTDLGGFAAATFKRGIRFINVATTLLGAVDAAVGGKTGINFMDLKNEIGAFQEAVAVIISTRFFATLPPTELRSGFAEMLKHGLISREEIYRRLLDFDIVNADLEELLPLLEESVNVKREVVAQDPREHGLRKALNLGHTAGHAFESLALERNHPIPHGVAVAHGLLVELILSHMQAGFPSAELYSYAELLNRAYNDVPAITCSDYPALLRLMAHDKKNTIPGQINFTLLEAPGTVIINQTATESTIQTALDLYRDLIQR